VRGESSSILPELVSGRGTAPRSGVVEGQARTCFRKDSAQHGVEVAQHFLRGNAQCHDARGCEPGVPTIVTPGTLSKGVRFPIDLDRQSCVGAIKVETIFARRVFAPELEAVRSLPQQLLQQYFGQTHFPPPSTRSLDSPATSFRRMILEHSASPPPCFAWSPSPSQARGGFERSVVVPFIRGHRPPRSGEEF